MRLRPRLRSRNLRWNKWKSSFDCACICICALLATAPATPAPLRLRPIAPTPQRLRVRWLDFASSAAPALRLHVRWLGSSCACAGSTPLAPAFAPARLASSHCISHSQSRSNSHLKSLSLAQSLCPPCFARTHCRRKAAYIVISYPSINPRWFPQQVWDAIGHS